MLKFDSSHNSLSGSLNKTKLNGKKLKQNLIIGSLVLSTVFFMSGCSKNVDCDIEGLHAHMYVSDEFSQYIVSEREKNWGYNRTENYIFVTEKEEEILSFANKKGLFVITENKEYIDKVTATHQDYIEYRYSYTYMYTVPHHHKIGKTTVVTYSYIPMTKYSWTADPKHSNLTGESRNVHYVYYGYKIIEDEKGKLKMIESDPVDNVYDLVGEFDYITSNFYKKVYAENKDMEVDYEDGQAEEQTDEQIRNSSHENSKNKVLKRQRKNITIM